MKNNHRQRKSYMVFFTIAFLGYSLSALGQNNLVYKDSLQSVENRIEDLLKRMTLEEKIGQLNMPVLEKVEKQLLLKIEKGAIGSFCVTKSNFPSLKDRNLLQRMAVEKSRLGIPVFFGFDAVHGFRTLFPTPLAISSSWDLELAKLSAEVSAYESRRTGMDMTFSPMVDVSKDPRWGRISECFGEDVLINSRFCRAFVEGYQQNSLKSPNSIAACLKHFVGYGAAVGGRDYQFTELSDRALRETYLPPFKEGVEAGAMAVMSAFNDISGIPASANQRLIRGILKDEWGYQGLVVSDWDAVTELRYHGIADTDKDAAWIAMRAGVDIEMKSNCYSMLITAIKQGEVSIANINDAVRRVLRLKFSLGLFENPYTCFSNDDFVSLFREKARMVAAESMVLLKNNGVLPLKEDSHDFVYLCGEWAQNTDVCGWWNGKVNYKEVVSVAEGLKKQLNSRLIFSETSSAPGKNNVAIVCLGEQSGWFGENHSRSDLELPDNQIEVVKKLKEQGISVIVVIFNGRPLVLTEIEKYADAILLAWHPGVEAGNAVADVLLGKVNPSGKLTVTFPRATGQIPVFYNERISGRPMYNNYIDLDKRPLYLFGYGMSYTSFSYTNLQLFHQDMNQGGFVTVSVDVANTGSREGKEIVQLYVHDRVASVTQPQKRLVDFTKVSLKAGERRKVTFRVTASQLSLWNETMEEVTEPGTFDIWVGGDSENLLHTVLTLLP